MRCSFWYYETWALRRTRHSLSIPSNRNTLGTSIMHDMVAHAHPHTITTSTAGKQAAIAQTAHLPLQSSLPRPPAGPIVLLRVTKKGFRTVWHIWGLIIKPKRIHQDFQHQWSASRSHPPKGCPLALRTFQGIACQSPMFAVNKFKCVQWSVLEI